MMGLAILGLIRKADKVESAERRALELFCEGCSQFIHVFPAHNGDYKAAKERMDSHHQNIQSSIEYIRRSLKEE